jgi:Rha family phage regulatory protein
LNFQQFIAAEGDELTTTSLQVAAVFGKRHDHVLRDVRKLLEELPASHRPNFGECFKINNLANGKREPYFRITRDGFTLLAMGFTGKKALAFKLAYIDAFNAMAAYVKNQREGICYRAAKFELADADSKRRGSYHGRGLNERKKEMPLLKAEEDFLKSVTNLALPGFEKPAVPDPLH